MFSGSKRVAFAALLSAAAALGIGYWIGATGNGRYEMYVNDSSEYILDTKTGILKEFYPTGEYGSGPIEVQAFYFNPPEPPQNGTGQ